MHFLGCSRLETHDVQLMSLMKSGLDSKQLYVKVCAGQPFPLVHDVLQLRLIRCAAAYPVRTIVNFFVGSSCSLQEAKALPHDGFMPLSLSLPALQFYYSCHVRCRCDQCRR